MRHPTRPFVALLVGLMSAFSVTSCVTRPAMQVIVEIDAEEDLKAEITSVRVELFGTSDDPPEPENQSFPSPHTWPFVAVLAPQNRDVTRRFRVQATASVGARTIITRASSGFAPDRTWHLRLRFERACLDLPCEVESSCRSGRCEGAPRCRLEAWMRG